MLRQRLLTGALLIGALVGLAWLDSANPTLATAWGTIGPGFVLALVLVVVIGPILARELARLAMIPGSTRPVRGAATLQWLAICLGAALLFLPTTMEDRFHALPAGLVGIFLLAVLACVFHALSRRSDGAIRAVTAPLMGLALIGIPLGFWLLLRREREAWTLVGAVLLVKSSDIGAYFTGMAIGRHPLIRWLSPGKTWEGLIGGVAVAATVGSLLAILSQQSLAADAFVEPVGTARGALIGAALGLAGVGGDLVESLLKRDAGRKDSGAILPGMGGLFDVMDSLLIAGPLAWWLLSA